MRGYRQEDPSKSVSQEVGRLVIPRLPDRILHTTKAGVLQERFRDFSCIKTKLPNLTGEQLLKLETKEPDLIDVKRLIELGLETWKKVEQAGICPFPDTPNKLFDIITNPGAQTGILEILPEKDYSGPRSEMVGGVVVHCSSEHFMATPPKELGITQHGIRLWVTDEARELGPRGTALDYMLSTVLEKVGHGRIGTRVMVEPFEIAHHANAATYRRYGFEDTEYTVEEPGEFRGSAITNVYRWMVYPPLTAKGEENLRTARRDTAIKAQAKREHLALYANDLLTKGEAVALIGPNPSFGYDLACQTPTNSIFTMDTRTGSNAKKPEPRINLYHYQQERGLLALPRVPLDCVIINNALQDISERGESVESFIGRVKELLSINMSRHPRLVVIEPNTTFSARDIEEMCKLAGFRILESIPCQIDGQPSFKVSAELVPRGAGVEIKVGPRQILPNPRFMTIKSYRDRETGATFQIAERPGRTYDMGLISKDLVYVQQSRPRPHYVSPDRGKFLDGSWPIAYPTEQLAGTSEDPNIETGARKILEKKYGINTGELTHAGTHITFPLIDESSEIVVQTIFTMPPCWEPIEIVEKLPGLETLGRVVPIQMTYHLQACLTKSSSDDRVARMIYHHLLANSIPTPAWTSPLTLSAGKSWETIKPYDLESAIKPEAERTIFEETEQPNLPYFQIRSAQYTELDAYGNHVGQTNLEYVTPSETAIIDFNGKKLKVGNHSVVLVPYVNTPSGILVLLGKQDSPTVQIYSKQIYGFTSSQYSSFPNIKVPQSIFESSKALEFAIARMEQDFSAESGASTRLGSSYMASPGGNLRTIHTYALEIVDPENLQKGYLVKLEELVDAFRRESKFSHLKKFIVDGPTQTGIFRLAHAVNLLEKL